MYKHGLVPRVGDTFKHGSETYMMIVMAVENDGEHIINAGWPHSRWKSSECILYGRGVEETDRIIAAANALYEAGVWSCDREVDEAALWTELRDALCRKPGTSPKPLNVPQLA